MSYRKLESLRAYVILAQDRISADLFRRDEEGSWLSEQIGQGENLRFESVEVTVPLNSLYEGIEPPEQ